jgi:hypothetical protein
MYLKSFLPFVRAAGLVGFFLLSACARQPIIDPPFYGEYRDRYAISADELKTLQFYISAEVLAHEMDATPGVEAKQVVIVAARTPGVVRDVGPDWLRVAFTKGGEGVLFRLRDDLPGATYYLATPTEGGKIALVRNLPQPVLIQGGRHYKIIRGADAYLNVSAKDINGLINSRPRAQGIIRE